MVVAAGLLEAARGHAETAWKAAASRLAAQYGGTQQFAEISPPVVLTSEADLQASPRVLGDTGQYIHPPL